MKKIASFTVNHLTLLPGVYVSRVDYAGGHPITTFDLRMTQPNAEPVMNTAEIHTIEHLGATFLRNHPDFAEKTIYFGPMGCRTGFYLLVRDADNKKVLDTVKDVLNKIAFEATEMFGAERKECGNYRELSLAPAVSECRSYLACLPREKSDFSYPEAE